MKEQKGVAGDNVFAEKARKLFDESVEDLDAQTRSRLNRGRQAAIEELTTGKPVHNIFHSFAINTAIDELATGKPVWVQWVPAAGVAAAAVFAVVLWTGNQPADELTPPATASDFEILLTEESFEMLEDLEFYSWIELDEEASQDLETDDVVG